MSLDAFISGKCCGVKHSHVWHDSCALQVTGQQRKKEVQTPAAADTGQGDVASWTEAAAATAAHPLPTTATSGKTAHAEEEATAIAPAVPAAAPATPTVEASADKKASSPKAGEAVAAAHSPAPPSTPASAATPAAGVPASPAPARPAATAAAGHATVAAASLSASDLPAAPATPTAHAAAEAVKKSPALQPVPPLGGRVPSADMPPTRPGMSATPCNTLPPARKRILSHYFPGISCALIHVRTYTYERVQQKMSQLQAG